MRRIRVEQFHPGATIDTIEIQVLKNSRIITFSTDVPYQYKYSTNDTKEQYGFNLYALCNENEYEEYLPETISVKLVNAYAETLPLDFNEKDIVYIVRDDEQRPLWFVLKDNNCEYWKNDF